MNSYEYYYFQINYRFNKFIYQILKNFYDPGLSFLIFPLIN